MNFRDTVICIIGFIVVVIACVVAFCFPTYQLIDRSWVTAPIWDPPMVWPHPYMVDSEEEMQAMRDDPASAEFASGMEQQPAKPHWPRSRLFYPGMVIWGYIMLAGYLWNNR